MSELKTILQFFETEAPALGVTAEMIKTPSADSIIRIYYFMCDLIFNIEDRDIYDSKNEIYGRSLMIIRIYTFLSGLFSDILNGYDFFYTDMVLPDPARTRFLLLQLIRFYRFKCDRQQELDQVANELEERKRDVSNEKTFEVNTHNMLLRERETFDTIKRKKLEMQNRHNELDKELARLKALAEENKKDFEHKQTRDQQLQTKLEEIQMTIKESEEKAKRLDMNIVSSPERIVRDINTMENELQEINKQYQTTTQLVRKLERDLSNQNIAKQKVDRFITELKQLEHIQDELSENRRLEDEKSQRVKEIEQQLRKCEQELAEMNSEHEGRIRDLNDKQANNSSKTVLLKQEKSHLEEDLQELANRIKKAKDELRDAQINLKKKEKALNEVGTKFKDMVRNLEDKYDLIEEKVREEERIVSLVLEHAMKICINSKQ